MRSGGTESDRSLAAPLGAVPSGGGQRVMLGLVIGAGILNYADRQIIAVLKPALEAELGWSDADYGSLVSAFQVAAALAFLFTGRLVDWIGLKWANPLAVGAWSLAAMAHAVAVTLPQFLGARVALGVTEAMATPAAIKTIAWVYGASSSRSLALGIMNGANSLGAILAPLGLPFLAAAVGWRATFLVVGGLGLVWVVLWVMATGGVAWAPETDERRAIPASAWGAAAKDRRSWAVIGAKTLSDQAWWFLLFWAPDLFHRLFFLDMKAFAVPLAVVYVMAAAGALLGGWGFGWSVGRGMTRHRARKWVFLTCGLCALPVPLVMVVPSVWPAVGLLGVILAAHQGFSTNLFALITDIVPSSRLGLVTSIAALSGNFAGMVILKITGVVLAGGGGYLPLLLWVGSTYLLAFLWIHWLLPERAEGKGAEGSRPAPRGPC